MKLEMSADRRLDGWKAIAGYLGRTVRTVQRWEREQQLPVSRLNHNALPSVYASIGDIDGWRDRRSNRLCDSRLPLAVSLCICDLTGHGAQLCRSVRHHVATALKRLPRCQVRYVEAEAVATAPGLVPRRADQQVVLRLALECASRESVSISARLTRNDRTEPVWFERIEDHSPVALRRRVAQVVVGAVRRQAAHASRRSA